MPEPYDFELSTERYRAFGPDLANLWHEGALHRVVDGREVRIGSADGGVDVEPLDSRSKPVVRKLLGAEFDLDEFYGFATSDPTLARARRGAPRPAAPDRGRAVREPRHLDHRPAGLAARRLRDPEPADRALRRPGRARVRLPDARADRRRRARRADNPRLLAPQGRVRRRPRAQRPRPRRPRRPARRRGQGHADRAAGDRRVDCRLVPRPPPRAASSLACGRPRRAEGGLPLLRRGPGPVDRRGARAGRALRPVREPERALPARRPRA